MKKLIYFLFVLMISTSVVFAQTTYVFGERPRKQQTSYPSYSTQRSNSSSVNIYNYGTANVEFYGDSYDTGNSFETNRSKHDIGLAFKDGIVGANIRFGYGFTYDAFAFGASFFGVWGERKWGVTLGWDGYHISNRQFKVITPKGTEIVNANGGTEVLTEDKIENKSVAVPLWNFRVGAAKRVTSESDKLIGYFSIGALLGKSAINKNNEVINLRDNVNLSKDVIKHDWLWGGFLTWHYPVYKGFGINVDIAANNKTFLTISGGITFAIGYKVR